MTLVSQHIILQSPASNDPLLDLNTQPSLDLQFATGKTLDDRVSGLPLVNHQRDASSGKSAGTYVGSDGLIKTSPANLYFPSTPTAINWASPATFTETDNYGIAPDGTNSSFRVTTTGPGYLQDAVNLEAGTTYTMSVYIKLEVARSAFFNIGIQGSAVNSTSFKDVLSELVVGQWVRVFHTFTADNTASASLRLMSGTNADAEFWGVQLEKGSTATDFIPTTTTASGAPRFDHDPVTGESLGLLIEESRTNLVLNSVSGVIRAASNMTGPTSVYGPGGTDTAFQYLSTGGTVESRIMLSSVLASSLTQYTATIYVKGVNYNTVTFGFGSGGFGSHSRRVFFLDTLTTNGVGGSAAAVSIEDAGNGWRRLRITTTATTSAGGIFAYLDLGSTASEAHTTDQGFQIYGFQVEAGSFPTSYIPTSGQVNGVTRAADVATIEGTNFSSWYASAPQTWFVEYDTPYVLASSHNPTILNLNNIHYNDGPAVRVQTETRILYWDNSLPTTFLSSTFNTNTLSGRYALSLDSPSGSLTQAYSGEASPETFTAKPFASVTSMYLGDAIGSSFKSLNGHISRLAYYPYRLADATLQEITS